MQFFSCFSLTSDSWIYHFKLHTSCIEFTFLRVSLWNQLWYYHFSDLICFSEYNFFCIFSSYFPVFIIIGKTNPKGILYKIVWFLELNTFYSAWNIFIVHASHFAFLKNKFILIHDIPHSFSIILARHISRLFLKSLLFTKALNIALDDVLCLHQDR